MAAVRLLITNWHTDTHLMPAPTEKQLTFLKSLGYMGAPPSTVGEASDLISALKDGLTSAEAEKGMLFERASPIEKARLYLADAEERKRNGNELAGWRLKVKRGSESSENTIYNGAFLPFDVGRKFPALLAISGLDFDSELQRRPAKGPIVVAPNQLTEITPGTRKASDPTPIAVQHSRIKKRSGCLGLFLFLITTLVSTGLLSCEVVRATMSELNESNQAVNQSGDAERF